MFEWVAVCLLCYTDKPKAHFHWGNASKYLPFSVRDLIARSMWQQWIITPLKLQFNIQTMNFNHEGQIKANHILLDIFCKYRNAIFSIEWTATKAPHYSFVGVKTTICKAIGQTLLVECESHCSNYSEEYTSLQRGE